MEIYYSFVWLLIDVSITIIYWNTICSFFFFAIFPILNWWLFRFFFQLLLFVFYPCCGPPEKNSFVYVCWFMSRLSHWTVTDSYVTICILFLQVGWNKKQEKIVLIYFSLFNFESIVSCFHELLMKSTCGLWETFLLTICFVE